MLAVKTHLSQALDVPAHFFSGGAATLVQANADADWTGFQIARQSGGDRNKRHKQVAVLADILQARLNGEHLSNPMQEILLRQAMSSADFPLVFGDVLDRELQPAYEALPRALSRIMRRTSFRDFRDKKVFRRDGLTGVLRRVGEGGDYQMDEIVESAVQYGPQKYGKGLGVTWEAMVNDDLGIFDDFPARLAMAAYNTEEQFLAELFAIATGWRLAFTKQVTGGVVGTPSALPLTLDNVAAAYGEMRKYLDPTTGEPILNRPVYLVYVPALHLKAMNIVNTTEVRMAQTLASPGTSESTRSILMGTNLIPIEVPWLPLVATTGTFGNTMWALFADPLAVRTGDFGYLRGYETPQVWVKGSNAYTPGGSLVGWREGDFEGDLIRMRVRHVMGGAKIDGLGAWFSNGQ